MKRPLFCCYLCDDSQSEYISPLALAFLAHVYHTYYIDHIPIHTPNLEINHLPLLTSFTNLLS